jgi:hypothetical protein
VTAKFLFDECISQPAMDKLKKLVSGEPHFEHLCSRFTSGIADNEWIPQLAQEGGWTVITADRARRGSQQGGKLPSLCDQFGITHVLISSTLHQRKSDEKVAALVLVWPEILQLSNDPAGTEAVLRYRSKKGTSTGCILALEKRQA